MTEYKLYCTVCGRDLGLCMCDIPVPNRLPDESYGDEPDFDSPAPSDTIGHGVSMSTNCIRCVVKRRTGVDLLCDDCRDEANETAFDAAVTPAKRHGRTFQSSYGLHCAECCNGDRCDDPTHFARASCPYCLGTGKNASCDEPPSDTIGHEAAELEDRP